MSSRVYYNQKDIIDEIQIRTGFSNYHIDKVLNTLSDVLKERLSDTHDIVEIKPFTGLKLISKHSTSKQISNLKDGYLKSDLVMSVTSHMTDYYKKDIKKLYKQKKSQRNVRKDHSFRCGMDSIKI